MSDNPKPLILAIDLGTSGPKIGLATAQGKIVAGEVGHTPIIMLPDGGVEQDPNTWWEAVKECVQKLLRKTAVSPHQITAVCCTAQWSGTVSVDKQGNHLRNAIIWMDARGAPYVHHVTNSLIKMEGYGIDKIWTWVRLTGGIPTHSGKDSIAHILYLKQQHPDIYAATYKFLEPKDYLNLRLTGRFAASTDSITLHWVTDNRNINQISYSDKLLRLAQLDRDKLPDLKQAVDILGPIKPEIAAELGLSPNTQVVMGTPDLHSAAIGSGAVRDYEGHLYIGTSSWLTCHVPFKKTDLFHNMAALPSAIPGRYFIVNEQETAGACLNYLKENILYPQDELARDDRQDNIYALFDQMAGRIPAGSDKAIFTPWLNGERTPVDDHLVRGGFHNMSLHHTRAHLIRAVLEGVAYNSRWLLGYVEKFAKRPFTHINFIGGGAKSAVWSQIHADVLNRPIHQMADPIQANARGAAILAAVGMGYTTFNEAAENAQVAHVYEPNPTNRAIYDELFHAFLTIYKQNRKLYGRLNKK
jgi:xylulokinase